jgi:hypothetical protein
MGCGIRRFGYIHRRPHTVPTRRAELLVRRVAKDAIADEFA